MKLKDLEKRLKSEPHNLGLRVQCAGMMREAGRSLEAVELYRSVALAYRDQGRTQQAIAVCKSILDIAPEDSACQGLLGMLQQEAQRATPVPVRPSRPSGVDLLRRQSQPELRPHNPVRSATPTGQRAGSATGPRASTPTGQRAPERAERAPERAADRNADRSAPSPTGPRPAPQTLSPPPPPGARAATTPSVTMRASPMPPAPEVPSLRPATSPVVGTRPLTSPPTSRPQTNPPPVGRSITRDRPLPRPQVLDRDSPVPPRPSRPSEHGSRRSSLDHTPLPPPMPYHQADRTSQPSKISSGDLQPDDDTRPDMSPAPHGHAPRKIAGSDTRGVPHEMDLAAELDTRQRRRIDSQELDKIAKPPPTAQHERVHVDDYDDLTTPPPRSSDDSLADMRGSLVPTPRGSDDALTPPSRRSTPSLPRIGPPPARTSSRPPIVVPPKTSSRPSIVSIPPKTGDSRPPGVLSPGSSPPGKLRPPPGRLPPQRPAMPRISRDSEDEMTQPREKAYDEDDDD